MKTALLALGLALGLAAVPAPAQVTTKASKSLLRIKWVKGKTYKYAVNVAAMVPGQKRPMNNAMTLKLDVTDVKGGIGSLKYILMGAGSNDSAQTARVDSLGKVLGKADLGELLIPFPEKAVAVGESWSQTTSGSSMYGKSTVAMKLTYRGVKNVNGKKVAEINISSTISGGNAVGKGTGLIQVSPDDGMVQSMDQSLSMQTKMTDSKGKTQTMDLPIKVSVTLQ
jgi:hypothetical protein